MSCDDAIGQEVEVLVALVEGAYMSEQFTLATSTAATIFEYFIA